MKKLILFLTLLSSTSAFAKTFNCVGTRSVKVEFKLQVSASSAGLQFVTPPDNILQGAAKSGDVVNLQRDPSAKTCDLLSGERPQDGISARICIPNSNLSDRFVTSAVFIFPQSNLGSTSEIGYEVVCQDNGR